MPYRICFPRDMRIDADDVLGRYILLDNDVYQITEVSQTYKKELIELGISFKGNIQEGFGGVLPSGD